MFQLYSISSMATIYHKKTTVVLLFEIGIFQNTKCENQVTYKSLYTLCRGSVSPSLYTLTLLNSYVANSLSYFTKWTRL